MVSRYDIHPTGVKQCVVLNLSSHWENKSSVAYLFCNIQKKILQLKCSPDTQLLKLILVKGTKESGIEKTVANTVTKLIRNDLGGIQLAKIDAFLVGEVRYEINIF